MRKRVTGKKAVALVMASLMQVWQDAEAVGPKAADPATQA